MPHKMKPGDEIDDNCHRLDRIPFGQLKDEAGKLETNFDGQLKHEPDVADDKERVEDIHRADGIVFCNDEPGGNGRPFMEKHAPLIGFVGGKGFGIRVQWKTYSREALSVFCFNCVVTETTVDMNLPEDAFRNETTGSFLNLVQAGQSPAAGFGQWWQAPTLDIFIGGNFSGGDGSAYSFVRNWGFIHKAYWFNGGSNATYPGTSNSVPFKDWLGRKNATGACDICDAVNGAGLLIGARCMSTLGASLKVHCDELRRQIFPEECTDVGIICADDGPFVPGQPPGLTPYGFTLEGIFQGFTHNGQLLEWDDPLSGIPPEVWFPNA